MKRVAVVALLLVVGAAAAPARAAEVSSAQLRTLAAQARSDRGALARLRMVDRVDGARVDIAGALRGARGAALDARLERLAEPVAAPSGDPAREARDVLAERRFHDTSLPRPLKGLFDRLGDIDVPVKWLDDLLPGPRSVVWIVLAGLLGGVAWLVARRALTTRVRAFTAEQRALAAARDEDPRELERRAAAAEAAGELEAALRLRFRAGLLRLDARGAIEFRPSISTVEVRRALHSEDFDALAATFDDVVYGGRAAVADDVAAARERWPDVVEPGHRRSRSQARVSGIPEAAPPPEGRHD